MRRRSGNLGEVRRQIAKGLHAARQGRVDAAARLPSSLALRSERIVIDSAVPYAMRIEQIYRPAIDLSTNLTTKVRIRKRVPPREPENRQRRLKPPLAERRASSARSTASAAICASRRTRSSSTSPAIEDGAQVIEAEVFDGARHSARRPSVCSLHKGLDARLKALDSRSRDATPAVRADVAVPRRLHQERQPRPHRAGGFQRRRRNRRGPRAIVARRPKGGKDPFKGKTGDFERHYLLEGANEIMPYRVYVPKGYAASKATPLVIALHGLGANEDSFFDVYSQLPPQLAEKHGFLMAAPLGFRRDGFYGSSIMGAPDAASRRRGENSEKDVLEVLRLMKAALQR